MKVTALAGGVGGAKLLVGLQEVVPGDRLTAIVNTADDAVIYGLHVSPDVDIVTYWLAGLADRNRGWGLESDSFEIVETLAALGMEAWFRLGDRDLATCLFRTNRLRDGATLSLVTDELRRTLGLEPTVLPMTDDRVRTKVVCSDGRTLGFQEYFVRERCGPEVHEVLFAGIADAKPAPGVVDAINLADVVIVCPSNPIVSIAPIVALNGVREALRAHPRVIAISPIVQGAALKGPAARMLRSMGVGSGAGAVARLYADFCDQFIVDSSDSDEAAHIRALGMSSTALPTIMADQRASEALAAAILAAG